MKNLVVALVVSVLVASCASAPNINKNVPRELARVCGETPRGALDKLFEGIAWQNIDLIREAIADGLSIFNVFGDRYGQRGRAVIKRIAADPELSGSSGCACDVLSMTDTSDPNEKIVVVRRVVMAGDDLRNYKRTFRVKFAPSSNCILSSDSIEDEWERM